MQVVALERRARFELVQYTHIQIYTGLAVRIELTPTDR